MAAKRLSAVTQSFGQHHRRVVGRLGDDAEDAVLHADVMAGTQAQLGRRLLRGVARNRQFLIHFQPPVFERLEGQVKRHHLGQRCRVAQRIRVGCMQNAAAFGVDHDVGIGRGRGHQRVMVVAMMAINAVMDGVVVGMGFSRQGSQQNNC